MNDCATCNGKGYVGDTASRHFPKCLDCPTVPLPADCANCNHSRAYHDGDGGRPCRAWAPVDSADQTTDNYCKCPGWKDKPAAAATTLAVPIKMEEYHGEEF